MQFKILVFADHNLGYGFDFSVRKFFNRAFGRFGHAQFATTGEQYPYNKNSVQCVFFVIYALFGNEVFYIQYLP